MDDNHSLTYPPLPPPEPIELLPWIYTHNMWALKVKSMMALGFMDLYLADLMNESHLQAFGCYAPKCGECTTTA